MRDPVFRGAGVADGYGRPVMLIPGFLAGDGSLAVMANWLRRTGHRTSGAGMLANVDCSGVALERLEQRLERLVGGGGRRAVIIGQSRGGGLAKALGCRRPDLVDGIVTLGSPQTDPLAVHPLVRLHVEGVATLGQLGAPGVFKRSCLDGECCAEFWTHISGAMPTGVGFVSVYSRSDGIVDWRACLDPYADDQVEIAASHLGMAVSPAAYRAIAAALERFGAPRAGRPTPAARQPLDEAA
jgi:pimeloyl-ACP methyl ester carboxylesterase